MGGKWLVYDGICARTDHRPGAASRQIHNAERTIKVRQLCRQAEPFGADAGLQREHPAEETKGLLVGFERRALHPGTDHLQARHAVLQVLLHHARQGNAVSALRQRKLSEDSQLRAVFRRVVFSLGQ